MQLEEFPLLYYGALKGSPLKWLDLDLLCRHLLPKDNINRIRYFTAKVRDELGLTTGVVNPHKANRRSRALQATFFKQLRPGALAASQFPAEITDAQGRKVSKPARW